MFGIVYNSTKDNLSGLSQNPYGKKIVDSALYVKDKGIEYSGAALSIGKETAVYAGKKGVEIGKVAYSKISENETAKSIGGAVYGKAVSAFGYFGGFISSATGIGAQRDEAAPEQPKPEEKVTILSQTTKDVKEEVKK